MDGSRLGAEPTAGLRTVLVAADTGGVRRYLKLSLDIQVTSSRRSISIASTRNGPALSALLCRLLADDPAGGRLLPMREGAGAGAMVGGGRDPGAIGREGVAGRLEPDAVAGPGGAFAARAPLT